MCHGGCRTGSEGTMKKLIAILTLIAAPAAAEPCRIGPTARASTPIPNAHRRQRSADALRADQRAQPNAGRPQHCGAHLEFCRQVGCGNRGERDPKMKRKSFNSATDRENEAYILQLTIPL